jgi:hypothetical protein
MLLLRAFSGLIALTIYGNLRTSVNSGLRQEVNGVLWSALIAMIESAAVYLVAVIIFIVLAAVRSYAQFVLLYSVRISTCRYNGCGMTEAVNLDAVARRANVLCHCHPVNTRPQQLYHTFADPTN